MNTPPGHDRVVDFERYRAARAQRVLPFAGDASSPAAGPGPGPLRALSARAVAHRARMLRFLSGSLHRPAR